MLRISFCFKKLDAACSTGVAAAVAAVDAAAAAAEAKLLVMLPPLLVSWLVIKFSLLDVLDGGGDGGVKKVL